LHTVPGTGTVAKLTATLFASANICYINFFFDKGYIKLAISGKIVHGEKNSFCELFFIYRNPKNLKNLRFPDVRKDFEKKVKNVNN
jgi:hypothetical protein